MEHVVHIRKFRWKFQLVSHFSSSFSDLEGADVSWGELSFDMEALGSLERCDPEIDMVSNSEVYVSAT